MDRTQVKEKIGRLNDEDSVAESTKAQRGDSKSSCSSGSINSNSSLDLGPTLGATEKHKSGSSTSSAPIDIKKPSQNQVGTDKDDFNEKVDFDQKNNFNEKDKFNEKDNFNEKDDINEKEIFGMEDVKGYRNNKKDGDIWPMKK